MNRSENQCYAMPYEQITFYGKIQGAGAAAPVRAPTTFSTTSSIGFMHTSNNFVSLTAADIARSGVGLYTVKFSDGLPVVLDIDAKSWGPSATAKDAYVIDYNPTTRIVSIAVFLQTGAAADLAAADFVTFVINGTKNVPVY